ncbi:hypothetical protein A0H76_1868 [Hepatospora eriocheir]|uniref:Uncharacterized protein n=1 Tax=Hepatospora eriocheir TaxID=1081669 RepID=A0A1X0QGN3_9MICR|nr:hypothetical protein A0H76_1868 [Hepatospora eriocheir]
MLICTENISTSNIDKNKILRKNYKDNDVFNMDKTDLFIKGLTINHICLNRMTKRILSKTKLEYQ